MRLRWLASDPDDPAQIAGWRALLDGAELAQADRFRQAADRRAYLAAHALARAMLTEATGCPPRTLRFVAGPHGRPELAPPLDRLGLRFNLSHTRGWVACAIARVAVGVDIEAVDREAALEVREVFAPAEVRLLAGRPDEQLAHTFTRLWTLKEAFIKATGEGLRRPLDSFWFTLDPVQIAFHPDAADRPQRWQFAELAPAPDRRLALAARRPGARALEVDARPARPDEVSPRRAGHN